MLNIPPIRLLAGSHANTAHTGSGCFMNVVAYLNGEAQITDRSTCVCGVVRPIAIWLNDFMLGSCFSPSKQTANSARLLPFIERAMGSATSDAGELSRRAWLAVDFARSMASLAKTSTADATLAAGYAADAASAADSFVTDTEAAAISAAAYATHATLAAGYAAYTAVAYEQIAQAGLGFLDRALPPAPEAQPAQVMARAAALQAIVSSETA